MRNIYNITLKEHQYLQSMEQWLSQWSYGQVLCIEGSDLPDHTRIDFTLNNKCGTCISVEANKDAEGKIYVEIPESMLIGNGTNQRRNYKIYAYIYESNNLSGETIHEIVIYVNARPKPDNSIYKY